MNRQAIRQIPSYDLYGEAVEMPDVLHCETIDARAALHDWNIRPHRHQRLHQFFLMTSGGGSAEVDGRVIALDPPLILSVPPRAVHAFAFQRGTQGHVLTIPAETLEQVTAGIAGRDELAGGAVLGPADGELVALFGALAIEHGRDASGRGHALTAWAGLVAAHAVRRFEAGRGPPHGTNGIVRRFEALVEAHFREHWPVSRHAGEIGVSPTHLSRLTRAATGLSASRLIEQRLMREARRALAYTNMTVSQIAWDLGFDDPAYFTRVFARATGRAPTAYRSGLERAASGAKPDG